MRLVVQRVKRAQVQVGDRVTGSIEAGFLILIGICDGDDGSTVQWAAKKCANLRVFPDDAGKMNRSLLDAGGQALVVSQFTLYGDCDKGNRPSFVGAAAPEVAEPLYETFVAALASLLGRPVATGEFGADMDVSLTNWGPVTLLLERDRPVSHQS